MPLPKPEPGLVVHYEYLWRHEHAEGRDQGNKRRPCAVVLAVGNVSGSIEVVVAPITHSPPGPAAEGIELPPRVKQHLGLDLARSWVIVTDLNVFAWPGPDLYPVPGKTPGTFSYGFLPPALFEQLRGRVVALGGAPAATRRTE